MAFSMQEYWSGLPFPSPEDLPDPGIEPGSPALEADALTSEPPGKRGLLVPCSLAGPLVIKQLMQMVTMVPGQGGQFQSACFP